MERKKGKVFLVGAGPGDPGLLTLRGASVLKSADVVVYDRLANALLLSYAPEAKKVFAGKNPQKKSPGHPEFVSQEKINQILLKLAREGKTVVRLKGGDPFIFGRGGEEASVLKKAGIPFEVVPGVSAAYAVPAYAGIPVTDRRFASSVTLLTAHEGIFKDRKGLDWKRIAQIPGTLVFFMGVKALPELAAGLIEGGKSPKTPVSVIEQGTLARQRVLEGNLGNISAKIKKANVRPPALAVIGDVNRLRRELDWFPSAMKRKPLDGKTVLVTRAGSQSAQFKQALESEGANVREFPVIQILPPKNWKPLDQAIKRLCHPEPQDDIDWIVFTSTNGVDAFFERLAKAGKDSRSLAAVKIAAIGKTTRERLLEEGIKADLVPKKFTSEDLIAELSKRKQIKGRHFLLPRTDIAPPYLKKALEKGGARVTQVTAYRTAGVCGPHERKKLQAWLSQGEIDFVTLTSASTADHFFALLPRQKRGKMRARVISIGPVTSRAAARYGVRPWREAREHTMKGMLDVLR